MCRMELLESGNQYFHYLRRTSRAASLTPEEQEQRARILKNDLLLHEAVIKNDVDAMKKVLREPTDVNSRNNYGRAPIHWASSRGNIEIMELLIAAKCDIEAYDKYGMRPLLMAAWHGQKDAVQLLINAGACVNAVNKKQYSLLMCAARNNRQEVVNFLLDTLEEVAVDAVDLEGQSALFHAALGGHEPILRRLVEVGASPDLRSKDERTALHAACEHGHQEVAEFLLSHEASIEARDHAGNTPLHIAAEHQQTGLVQLLLDTGADVNPQNSKGLTPLHIAARLGSRGIIEALIQHSSALNIQCKNGNTPLHLACQANETDTVETLIEKGADLNCLNNRSQSAIHIGAEMGHTDICRVLLAAGADIEQREQAGKTPLYIAARGSFTAIVDMIIKTARLDYPAPEEQNGISKETQVKPVLNTARKRWRTNAGEDGRENGKPLREDSERLRSVLWRLAYKQLAPSEWKRLALYWAFTEEQIRAIEHQYTGPTSYKEHGFRMLLIWLHGLADDVNPLKELYESLTAIGKKSVADTLRKKIEKENCEANKRKHSCKSCCIV